MSFPAPQTPHRPGLPGAYIQTPAQQTNPRLGQITQPNNQSKATSSNQQYGSRGQSQGLSQPTQQAGQLASLQTATDLKPIQRASRTINETLAREAQFPELDTYVGQGPSSEYEISSQSAWAPFQRIKMYDIPEKIFEQYNQAQLSTMMGLFADLNHAWVAIDNAMYIWDYTQPDPPLIGFEDQKNTITAVEMVKPRAGVFLPSVTRLLVVATTVKIYILGIATQPAPTGGLTLALYSTGMEQTTKGMDIRIIAGSPSTGRIFFSGKESYDVFELTYKQEETWFQTKTAMINHTGSGMSTFAPLPLLNFGSKTTQEYNIDIVVDDSRRLVYTLSSRSTIRVFSMSASNALTLAITKTINATFNDISHMLSAQTPTDLITNNTKIVAIAAISSQEASKMHLMATTSTGCRIFLSGTSTSYYSTPNSSRPPNSMIVQHVKFPPPDAVKSGPSQVQGDGQIAPYGNGHSISTQSKALSPTRGGERYAPGYFFCFGSHDKARKPADTVFVSAQDAGRMVRPQQDASRPIRFPELGLWLNLGARVEAIGLVSPPFNAAGQPSGFANELAVQFDKPASEVAILTNTGVHTLRRRRLVDMFAATIKTGGGDNGLEGEIKKFIRQYGRGETASTALAVACGQGLDITTDARVAKITDPEVLEFARKAFIEYGGKPQFYENNVVDQSVAAIDMVHPSPRHEGLALYVSRLVRSIWKSPVIIETISPAAGLSVLPVISASKLQGVAQDLQKLKEFLNANRSFISGLAGPDSLERAATKQEEISLQAEHRALHSQLVLIDNVIEGIAFIQVLFDERLTEIMLTLSNETRQQVRNLTYESLFSTTNGKDLAKELVKAIVNRNIANGSNVETVAEALRRRCGSFCSADDVIIFKAQEQLKRSSEAGSDSELGRNLLNESLRLFTQVAGSLSMEQLQWAVTNFTIMQFYAGAIQLALTVAFESDRGNRALSWIQEGRPDQDPRAAAFASRKRCYDLIHDVITNLDNTPLPLDEGPYSLSARRRIEAREVIDTSDDEAFQTDLYDWYLIQGRTDRILEIQSPYIVTYLERRSSDDIAHADLLWRYHTQIGHNHQAAEVQLALAKSEFTLLLDSRIEYLGRAKANASTPTAGVARATRHALLREVSDLLDLANIQSDLFLRLKNDPRVAVDRQPALTSELNGPILTINTLYNQYADQASYYDLCLLIYQAADHRNPADIRNTWQNLIDRTHQEASEHPASETDEQRRNPPEPYTAVADSIRSLGRRLNLDDTMFPIPDILPLLERYSLEYAQGLAPKHWVLDTLADIAVPYESMYHALEAMFYNDEAPFHGRNRRFLAQDLVAVVSRWLRDNDRRLRGPEILGGEASAGGVSQCLGLVERCNGLDEVTLEECRVLRGKIERMLR